MLFDSPDGVKDVVRKRKKNIGKNGGLILPPTHVLEPEVTVEKELTNINKSKLRNEVEQEL